MEVVLVEGDDWAGLYVDGVLVREDHRIGATEVLSALSVGKTIWLSRTQDKRLCEEGSLPGTVSDLENWLA